MTKKIVQEPFYALLDNMMLVSWTSESDADTSSSPYSKFSKVTIQSKGLLVVFFCTRGISKSHGQLCFKKMYGM